MKSVLEIQIQKLFILTILLKIGSSYLGWRLQDPWILGFAIPLTVMALYIVIGYNRRDTNVSDEKFADSCYYLGFIFTITSIIFSLFDLPQIGTKIQDIAVRFGAAMVSTVFGLIVRVALVSFKKDADDAIRDVESSLVDASVKFRMQLEMALEKLHGFQDDVDVAAKETVARISLQVESMTKDHAEKLSGFFAELSERNEKVFAGSVNEVKSASVRLSGAFENYANSMRASVTSIEKRVEAFANAVTERLEATTFPDDFFKERLEEPLQHLINSTKEIAKGVNVAASQVGDSSALLTTTLKKIRTKAKTSEDALDKVVSLSEQQEAILEAAQGQLTTLHALTSALSKIDSGVAESVAALKASHATNTQLLAEMADTAKRRADVRESLEHSMATVIEHVKAGAAAASSMAEEMALNTSATQRLLTKLEGGKPEIKPFSAYGTLDSGRPGAEVPQVVASPSPVALTRVTSAFPSGEASRHPASTDVATSNEATQPQALSSNSRESNT